MIFDRWAKEGARGWGYADVLPYFRRMERFFGRLDEWRGTGGPLDIRKPAAAHPLHRAFIEAGRQAGYGVTEDYKGIGQEASAPCR